MPCTLELWDLPVVSELEVIMPSEALVELKREGAEGGMRPQNQVFRGALPQREGEKWTVAEVGKS